MKLHWFDNKRCLLLSGGDDNAVAFTICAWGTAGTPEVDTLIVPRAHAAAVTGIEVLASPGLRLFKVATTSIDQRVKIWEVHYNATQHGVNGLTVKRKGNYSTAVADVSGLAALDDSLVIVYGVGLDVCRHKG